MHGYLSLDIICSSKITVFLELRSRKTVRFSEQIMSADKYPCIFSRQMETIVYIYYNNNKYRKSNKEQQKFWTCSSWNCLYLLLLKFQPVRYFWENDVIFSNSQPSLETRSSNGGREFSETKVKKEWLLMFVMDWNLARYVRKSYCTRKCKKMNTNNLIVVAL